MRNDLDELCLASPAAVGDGLLMRTASRLTCITEGARPALGGDSSASPPAPKPGSAGMDIWSAAAAGNLDEVARNLTAGISVDAREPSLGMTSLMMASLFGQADVARLLREEGADVSPDNNEGNTALHMASFLAHPKIVKLLVEKGAAVNARNAKSETALDIVSAAWTPEVEAI